MIFRWMLGGIILVSLAFFLPARTVEISPSLNAAGIAALIYIIALLVYVLRNPIPIKHRIVVGVVAFMSVIALGAHWTGMLNTTQWQQGRLLAIKSLVVRGVLMSEAPINLVSVLEEYHTQGKVKKLSLAKIFLREHPQATTGSNIYNFSAGEDSARIFVTALSDSMVVLTASHAFAQGRTGDFRPYWGRRGALQERFILTEKGVRHESDN
jgi:hypothetical protein